MEHCNFRAQLRCSSSLLPVYQMYSVFANKISLPIKIKNKKTVDFCHVIKNLYRYQNNYSQHLFKCCLQATHSKMNGQDSQGDSIYLSLVVSSLCLEMNKDFLFNRMKTSKWFQTNDLPSHCERERERERERDRE